MIRVLHLPQSSYQWLEHQNQMPTRLRGTYLDADRSTVTLVCPNLPKPPLPYASPEAAIRARTARGSHCQFSGVLPYQPAIISLVSRCPWFTRYLGKNFAEPTGGEVHRPVRAARPTERRRRTCPAGRTHVRPPFHMAPKLPNGDEITCIMACPRVSASESLGVNGMGSLSRESGR